MELRQGNTLNRGKYKIVKKLGQGSFGITYLATTRISMDGQLGKLDVNVNVTIKEFFMSDLNNRSSDGTSVEWTSSTLVKNYKSKFRKEAESLAKLHHPNIVKVLEVFDENNTTYYVMEFIDGETIDDYIKRNGKLAEDESLRIVSEVCSALSYMHDHKMLHLDLKPKNMMRSSEGQIYLIDFGLAKQYDENGEPESSTTLGLGTVGYAPIERVHFKRDGSFPVTLDIYAVGASLYKMLTGKTPPESSYVLNEGLPLSPLKEAGISEETIGIVKKAMAPIKKERYQTVRELLMAINNSPVDNDEETVIRMDESPTVDERTVFKSNHKDSNDREYITDDNGGYDDIDDEPSFFEKYWKYGLIGAAVLLGVYFCTDRNGSQNASSIDELTVDSLVDTLATPENVINEATLEEASKKENKVLDEPQKEKVKETPNNKSDYDSDEKFTSVNKEKNLQKTKVDDTNTVYDVVEQLPSFPGGNQALMKFLQENVKYPAVAEEHGIQGRVVVSFIVEKDGSITNEMVVSSVDPSLDVEALRVVKSMPHWMPGKQNGVPVRVKYNIPISYKLQ